jgi:hypothetical protein
LNSINRTLEPNMQTIDDISRELRPRELAHRRNCGIDVRLLWDPDGGGLTVEVLDDNEGSSLVVPVGGRSPLEVFQHPYAYAA